MNLDPYIEQVQEQVVAAAQAGGPEAEELAGRLVGPLGSALRLAIQDALARAADEITLELAPGAVELRLRGREPDFVVTLPPATPENDEPAEPQLPPVEAAMATPGEGVARINLRLPDRMKERVEEAAAREGLSVNAWLVRATGTVLERSDPRRPARRAAQGSQRMTGWVE